MIIDGIWQSQYSVQVGLLVCIGCVYLVNGESDAPAAEEQRAPANGWCDLEGVLVS